VLSEFFSVFVASIFHFCHSFSIPGTCLRTTTKWNACATKCEQIWRRNVPRLFSGSLPPCDLFVSQLLPTQKLRSPETRVSSVVIQQVQTIFSSFHFSYHVLPFAKLRGLNGSLGFTLVPSIHFHRGWSGNLRSNEWKIILIQVETWDNYLLFESLVKAGGIVLARIRQQCCGTNVVSSRAEELELS
jgi:hypothetical protein